MPISGLVIRIDALKQQQIRSTLAAFPGLELQPIPTTDVLVATIESCDFGDQQALTERISAVPGVNSVAVAYHNFEDMVADERA